MKKNNVKTKKSSLDRMIKKVTKKSDNYLYESAIAERSCKERRKRMRSDNTFREERRAAVKRDYREERYKNRNDRNSDVRISDYINGRYAV